MRAKSMVPGLLISLLLGSFSLQSFGAFSFGSVSEKRLEKNIKVGCVDVDEKSDQDFKIELDSIEESKLQISMKMLSKREYGSSPLKRFDLDGIFENMKDEDAILISKSACAFPSVLPSFFSVKNHLSKEFSQLAFQYKELHEIKEHDIKIRRKTGPKEVDVVLHLQDHNFETGQSTNITKDELDKIEKLAPLGREGLKQFFSYFSNENDVMKVSRKKEKKSGTRGQRTLYYIYKLGEKSSLVVSVKLTSFKKQDISAADWGTITGRLGLSFTRKSAKESMERKQKYFYTRTCS